MSLRDYVYFYQTIYSNKCTILRSIIIAYLANGRKIFTQ